jgi:hypothetical protein
MTAFLLILAFAAYLSSHPPDFVLNREKTPTVYTDKDIYKYEQKILRDQEKEKYEYSLMPESGYMTIEEYEQKSTDILTSERKVESYEPPKDKSIEYTPQPIYTLVKYNNPAGAPDLKIGRKLLFDREFVSPGIVSPDKSFLIYPVHNFYAVNQCVTGDLYMIKLDMEKPEVQRVLDANIIKRVQKPILSTSKDISEKYIFRSLTPIDFSEDGNLLLVKEKIGSIQDGIWQTNIIVYNFRTQTAHLLTEAQETVKYYWKNRYGIFLDEKRWDIYPIGFSQEHPDIIIFNAFGYTGHTPQFLGTWSIDIDGEYTEIVSPNESSIKMGMNGYKIAQKGVLNPALAHNAAVAREKEIKERKKAEAKAEKENKKKKKMEYQAKIKEMKAREKEVLKNMK